MAACNISQEITQTQLPGFVELPYNELLFAELDQEILADPGLPGCSLADLPPFGWKEVDSGLVDIRTPEDYAIRVGSLYQEGYRNYIENRVDFPEIYQDIPEMSYEEFLEICNVFPEVDFSRYSLLGHHAVGSGCIVNFGKDVFRSDQDQIIIYELSINEQGSCERMTYSRNLILVPRIPSEYQVIFSVK